MGSNQTAHRSEENIELDSVTDNRSQLTSIQVANPPVDLWGWKNCSHRLRTIEGSYQRSPMGRWTSSSEDFGVCAIHPPISSVVQSDEVDIHPDGCVSWGDISPIVPGSTASNSSNDRTRIPSEVFRTIDLTSLIAESEDSGVTWAGGSGILVVLTTDWKTFSSDFDKSLKSNEHSWMRRRRRGIFRLNDIGSLSFPSKNSRFHTRSYLSD